LAKYPPFLIPAKHRLVLVVGARGNRGHLLAAPLSRPHDSHDQHDQSYQSGDTGGDNRKPQNYFHAAMIAPTATDVPDMLRTGFQYRIPAAPDDFGYEPGEIGRVISRRCYAEIGRCWEQAYPRLSATALNNSRARCDNRGDEGDRR
jgi:hypothetical protein